MSARQTLTIDLRRSPEHITVRREVAGAVLSARGAVAVKGQLEALVGRLVHRRSEWVDGLEDDIGWCALGLQAIDGGFDLDAPRFDDDPRALRTKDLTVPLSITSAWARVGSATDTQPSPVRFDATLRAVLGWERHSMLTITRVEAAEPGDSGWLIEPHASEPGTWDSTKQERLEAWMVHALRPAVIRAAALPPGFGALIQDDDIRVVVDQADGAIRSHLIR